MPRSVYLLPVGKASSSRWCLPPEWTDPWLFPEGREVPHRSQQIQDMAPGRPLDLRSGEHCKPNQVFNFSLASTEFAYPLHFCSTGKETSKHCPDRQHYLPQPRETPPYYPIGLSPPPSLACLCLHFFFSAYPKALPAPNAPVKSKLCIQVFALSSPPTASCNDSLPVNQFWE